MALIANDIVLVPNPLSISIEADANFNAVEVVLEQPLQDYLAILAFSVESIRYVQLFNLLIEQPTGRWTRSHEIAIDSGFVLIGDDVAFREEELAEELFFGQQDVHLFRAGIMTDSGYGDGIYHLKVKQNRDKQIIRSKNQFHGVAIERPVKGMLLRPVFLRYVVI